MTQKKKKKKAEVALVCVFLLGKLLGKFWHYSKGNTNVSVLMFITMSALWNKDVYVAAKWIPNRKDKLLLRADVKK